MPSKSPTHKPPGWKPREPWAKQGLARQLTGRPWRRLRALILQRDGFLCQPCSRAGRLTTATEVDHIKAVSAFGTDDHGNLEAICSTCHKDKTAKEAAEGLRRA